MPEQCLRHARARPEPGQSNGVTVTVMEHVMEPLMVPLISRIKNFSELFTIVNLNPLNHKQLKFSHSTSQVAVSAKLSTFPLCRNEIFKAFCHGWFDCCFARDKGQRCSSVPDAISLQSHALKTRKLRADFGARLCWWKIWQRRAQNSFSNLICAGEMWASESIFSKLGRVQKSLMIYYRCRSAKVR